MSFIDDVLTATKTVGATVAAQVIQTKLTDYLKPTAAQVKPVVTQTTTSGLTAPTQQMTTDKMIMMGLAAVAVLILVMRK